MHAMDQPAKLKSFTRYNPPQQQQLQLQIRPAVFKSISHTKSSSFEDISFSSFLKPKDQSDAAAAPEISIFDAHKYFCETNNTDSHKKESPLPPRPSLTRLSSVSSDGYGRNSRTRSFHATPTASSEASWNSQTGLLINPPGSLGVSLNNLTSRNNNEIKNSGKNGIFRRKSSCCCTGGKSVRVNEATTVNRSNSKRDAADADQPQRAKPLSITSDGHHIAQIHPHKKFPSPENVDFPAPGPADQPRQRRISASGRPFVDVAGGFSFPILKNPTLPAEKPDPKGDCDPPRDSLEVFQPNAEDPAGARSRFNPGSPRARVETTDDDMGSDASSDLFELESFSTNTTVYPTYRRRDSLDEALTFNARRFASANGLNPRNNAGGRRSLDESPTTPSVAATECYAPSEVSIDWSVTTAEGLDRPSVSNFSSSASEIGGAAIFRQRIPEEGGGKKKGSGGGGLLLMSCRDGKAVSVGPQPVKCSAAEGGGGGTPALVVGKPPRATKTTTLVNDHSRRIY